MHDLARRGFAFAVATGGLLLTNVGYAVADGASASGTASGSPGVASGNDVHAPVNAPVCFNGNSVSGIGAFNSAGGNSCDVGGLLDNLTGNGEPRHHEASGDSASARQSSFGSPGVLSGNNVAVPVNAPICVSGNTVSVIGALNSSGGNDCAIGGGERHGRHHGGTSATAEQSAALSPGIGSGNNVAAPVNAPVNVCGNTVSVIGALNSANGNDCSIGGSDEHGRHHGGPSSSAEQTAVGSPGVLSGDNVAVPINVPINFCGNTITGIGALNSSGGNDCAIGGGKGNGSGPSSSADQTASLSPGILSGDNVAVPINVPLNICGNTITGIGALNFSGGNDCAIGGGKGGASSSAEQSSSLSPGIGSGNNIALPINVPVNICGNTITGIGALNSSAGNECLVGPPSTPSTPSTPPTSPSTPPTSPSTPPTSPSTPPTSPSTPPTSPSTPPTSPSTPPTSSTTPPVTTTSIPTSETTSPSVPTGREHEHENENEHGGPRGEEMLPGGKGKTPPPCVLTVKGSSFDSQLKEDGPLAVGFAGFAAFAGFTAGRTTRRRHTREH